jgi:hypothetical protein
MPLREFDGDESILLMSWESEAECHHTRTFHLWARVAENFVGQEMVMEARSTCHVRRVPWLVLGGHARSQPATEWRVATSPRGSQQPPCLDAVGLLASEALREGWRPVRAMA